MKNPSRHAAQKPVSDIWPADVYIICYLLLLMVLVLTAPGELPDRSNIIFEMNLLILLSLLFATGVDPDRGNVLFFLRSTYHLLPILYAFRLLHFLVPALRQIDGKYETLLINWDLIVFGTHVPLYFRPARSPLLTELMYYFYISYYVVPFIVVIAVFLKWTRNELGKNAIQKVSGGFTLGFVSSYLIYMLVPARGPWYGIGKDVLETSLNSAWIGEQIRTAIFTMEMEMYDAFPSGHTEVYLIAVLFAWKYTRKLFWPTLILFIGMAISTMYLQFHYGMDVIAGALLAFVVVWIQDWLH